ncbi:transporter [Ancylomarina sp. DW003]|nr:transporter [Ancylomarina sp. DW003]MDE5423996.1 transporter [Ancylomarina sp. DW003]
MKHLGVFSILILLLIGQTKLFAQACCTGGAPISSNLGVQNYASKQLSIDINYDYNSLRDLYAASRNLNDSRRTRDIRTLFFRTSYAINDKWSFSVILPYLWQKQVVRSDFGRSSQSSEGIGDLVILAQRDIINNYKHQLLIAVGPKLPTGSISKKDSEFGIPLAPDMQPGTGSLDGIAALSYSRFGIMTPTSSAFALFTYRYSFAQNRNSGQEKYRFGNELTLNLGLAHSIPLRKWSLSPSLHYRYRKSDTDDNDGFDFPNTGGEWMYLVPSLKLKSAKGLTIHSSIEIPIHTKVTGTQLITSKKWQIGMTYPINLKRDKTFSH